MRSIFRLGLLGSFVLLTALPGCANEATSQEADATEDLLDSAGLASLTIDEVGRFYREGRIDDVAAEGKQVPAIRFNTFGGTKIHLEVTGPGAPVAILAGPLPDDERTVVLSKKGRNGKATVDATLEKPGAYKVLVGAGAHFDGRGGVRAAYSVSYRCVEACTPKQMPLDTMIKVIKANVGAESLARGIDQLVDSLVPAEDLRGAFKTQIRDALARDSVGAVPVVSFAKLGEAQGLFDHAPRTAASSNDNGRKDVDLDTVGATCVAPREMPKPVSDQLPGIERGHAPDYAIDDCMLARLRGLSDALNALSMQNGSNVTMAGHKLATPGDVAAALIETGHSIRVENARFIADFLGLNYRGTSVISPMWIDTGISLPAGGTLRIPAPHGHHNLWIEGPRFRGQLAFFMGVPSGTRFTVAEGLAPEWGAGPNMSGRVLYAFDSKAEREAVIETFDGAGALRKKWTHEGTGMPFDGYGQLGVCTDSVAVLEYQRTGTATLFPLLHPRPRQVRDDIDRVLAALPSDPAGFDPADALRRIELSLPTTPSASPFRTYADGMRALGR